MYFSILLVVFFMIEIVANSPHHRRRALEEQYCKFNETLKSELRSIQCNAEEWDECAARIREIVQNSTRGTWGAVVVGDEKEILEERIDWYISSYRSENCRMLIDNVGKNDKMLIEVFRTGFLANSINDDHKKWQSLLEKNISTLTAAELCPHSNLRNLIYRFHVKTLIRRRKRNIPEIQIHKSAKRLSKTFFDETWHEWNIFVVKHDVQNVSSLSIGFEFPYYHYNAQPGFCVGISYDGYMIIGIMSEYINDTFNELLFLL